jgi:hypothetical protein
VDAARDAPPPRRDQRLHPARRRRPIHGVSQRWPVPAMAPSNHGRIRSNVLLAGRPPLPISMTTQDQLRRPTGKASHDLPAE